MPNIQRDVSDLVGELIFSLPRSFHDLVPVSSKSQLEQFIFNIFVELATFFATAVKLFQSHLTDVSVKKAWSGFKSDYSMVARRIKRVSQQVDLEIEIGRSSASSSDSNGGIAPLLEQMSIRGGAAGDGAETSTSCFMVPNSPNRRFVIRQDLLDQIVACLQPASDDVSSRSLALHGIGGVGKTQTALQYACTAREKKWYDAILWISAESYVKITEDYAQAAHRLGLVPRSTSTVQDPTMSKVLVKEWLARTSLRWFIVFNNADDLEVLQHAWATGATGSALVTTRDFNASLHPASHGIHVQPFDANKGASALLTLLDRNSSYGPDDQSLTLAKELSGALGGLPLALNQVSAYMQQSRLSIDEFVPLFKNSRAKIFGSKPAGSD